VARQRVGREPAAGEPVEPAADLGIEAEAHGIAKRMAVGRARVDGGDAAAGIGQELKRPVRRGGNSEVECEPVARAAGNERERGRGADERLCDLVHRAVAADRDHPGAVVVDRGERQLGGMTRRLGGNEVGVEPVPCDEGVNRRHQARVAAIAA